MKPLFLKEKRQKNFFFSRGFFIVRKDFKQ